MPWITISDPSGLGGTGSAVDSKTSNGLAYAASIWGPVALAALVAAGTAYLQHHRGRQPLYGLLYIPAAGVAGYRVEAEVDRNHVLNSVTILGEQIARVETGAGLLLARSALGLLSILGVASAIALLLQWSRTGESRG